MITIKKNEDKTITISTSKKYGFEELVNSDEMRGNDLLFYHSVMDGRLYLIDEDTKRYYRMNSYSHDYRAELFEGGTIKTNEGHDFTYTDEREGDDMNYQYKDEDGYEF